jgi:FKBP-type peptidyl-prolyl cis-trans isomerase FkpA/FKBP-type peptidyl-prolyl cis-trans isomerase FklB
MSIAAVAAEPKTEEQKTFYALGVAISQNLASFNLTPAELELVKSGLTDGASGKTTIDLETYAQKLGELQSTRMAATAESEKKSGAAFVDKAAAEKGATKTASGIVIKTVTAGTGASPTGSDTVRVHYHGTTPDGKVFDSSRQRNEPATFPLDGVIPCWTEALQTMKVGGKSRIVCPPSVAYGDRGTPNIKPGATLVFDVELLEIQQKAQAPQPQAKP